MCATPVHLSRLSPNYLLPQLASCFSWSENPQVVLIERHPFAICYAFAKQRFSAAHGLWHSPSVERGGATRRSRHQPDPANCEHNMQRFFRNATTCYPRRLVFLLSLMTLQAVAHVQNNRLTSQHVLATTPKATSSFRAAILSCMGQIRNVSRISIQSLLECGSDSLQISGHVRCSHVGNIVL